MPRSSDSKSITATCPATKKLVGTGFQIIGGLGEVVIDDLRPDGGPFTAPTSVVAGGYAADPNYRPDWFITSYAICANTAAMPGLVRIAATSPAGVSPDSQTISASCGAKRLLGTGAEITGAEGEVVLDDLRPNAVPPTTNFATGYEADPDYLPNWNIVSYAICAKP